MPAWRASIGYVPQEVYLNDSSPAQNIAFGVSREDIDINRVEAVAKLARVHETIEALPQGYWTPVGERGSLLSGGQKQRVAIARAIIKKPKVLLLDEATSALDKESEALVQQALDRVMVNQTSVVIAHRISTIENVDCIYVLKEGKLVEQGKF